MDEIVLTERHVQAIWYDRDLRPENLLTSNGERVCVVHPGEWNGVTGPDFRGAVLEVGKERRRLVGDVEIHLSPSDWDAHGHGSDPAYKNVVAHVTWRSGAPPSSLPGGAVSIWLGKYLSADVSPSAIDTGAYPFGRKPAEDRPCRRRLAHDPNEARKLLARAGYWRIKAKAERMSSLLRTGDRNQVFYAEMMNALGYGKNSAGFRMVAAAVPYAVMRDEPGNALAAFRVAAGFVEWHRDHVRPNNAPEARLQSAARLFTETDVLSLSEVNDVSRAACRRMISLLTEGHHVGRGRAAAMVANIVVPFALAHGRIRDVPDWLPPEDVCSPVRRAAYRMFGGDHNPKAWYAANGIFMQGLIQIDREWCARHHPTCDDCEMEIV